MHAPDCAWQTARLGRLKLAIIMQGSEWLDRGAAHQFGPFSDCAHGHVAVRPKQGARTCTAKPFTPVQELLGNALALW